MNRGAAMRIEKDSLGEIKVPDDALYGIHTLRSMENFSGAGEPLPLEIVYEIVRLKNACADANAGLGLIDAAVSDAIKSACNKILTGRHDDSFPVDIFQAGSGTSTQMNVNEVIANLAAVELGGSPGLKTTVHPNDHVNKGQSTNNIFPSAIRMACIRLGRYLIREMDALKAAFCEKAAAFSTVRKSGRTHLQDAVPITLGQEFSAYAHAITKAKERIEGAGRMLLELGVGGNAVGTGVNTAPDFRARVISALNTATKMDFKTAENGIEITQFLTDMGHMSSMLRLLALDLLKIVNDLRLLGSGPSTGLREIKLPPVEPGSSIMPGKINPSICEAANMACMQVVGYDSAVAMACGAGQLELNTHMPLVGANLVKSFNVLTRTIVMLREKCIKGIKADKAVCREYFEKSAGLATILNPVLGYDRVAELVKEGISTGKTLKEMVLDKHLIPEKEFDILLESAFGPNPMLMPESKLPM